MQYTKKILIDADAFVALNYLDDSSHNRAVALSQEVKDSNIPLITSDPAFGEAVTVISQRGGLELAAAFAEDILGGEIEIVEVDASLRRKALDIFKRQTSKNSRFTDCINMAIMEEKKLNTIFSFDVQYKKNKFKRFGIDK